MFLTGVVILLHAVRLVKGFASDRVAVTLDNLCLHTAWSRYAVKEWCWLGSPIFFMTLHGFYEFRKVVLSPWVIHWGNVPLLFGMLFFFRFLVFEIARLGLMFRDLIHAIDSVIYATVQFVVHGFYD